MGANLQDRVISNDPTQDDLPLPPGYTTIEDRKVDFLLPESTEGVKGLAFAVLLMAVSDGCNPRWLEEIAEYYQVPVDPKILYRMPHSKSYIKDSKGRFVKENDLTANIKRVKIKDPVVKDLVIPDDVLESFAKSLKTKL